MASCKLEVKWLSGINIKLLGGLPSANSRYNKYIQLPRVLVDKTLRHTGLMPRMAAKKHAK